MFDIGFAELLLIAVVGLLVIGPEQLPGTIRTISLWLGRLRRSFNEIKSDIEREIGADDIKRQLHNETILKELENTRTELNSIVSGTEESVNKTLKADDSNDKK